MSRESRQAEAEDQMREAEADWEMHRYEERRRDLFAAHAMAAMLPGVMTSAYKEGFEKTVATAAFGIADAMLAASENR